MGGWGTADALAYLELFGPEIEPEQVLYFVNYDDFERALRRRLYTLSDETGLGLTARDLSGSRWLWLKRLTRIVPGYHWLLEHSQLFQFARTTAVRELGAGHADYSDAIPKPDPAMDNDKLYLKRLARALISRMNSWCRERDIPLLVMTTGWPLVDYPWLSEIMAAEGVDFIDNKAGVTAGLGANIADFEIGSGDIHPNSRGARVVADAVWPHLRNRLNEQLR